MTEATAELFVKVLWCTVDYRPILIVILTPASLLVQVAVSFSETSAPQYRDAVHDFIGNVLKQQAQWCMFAVTTYSAASKCCSIII